MADLQRKTANLLNVNTGVRGYYINANGVEVVNVSSEYEFAHTQKIPVEPNTKYTYSLSVQRVGVYRRIMGYDVNGDFSKQITDFLTNTLGYNIKTITIPENCYYITINYIDDAYNNADLNMMLNVGSTAKPYEPYGWVHSLRKLTTATEAVENPLYSDGTAITAYTIKGNTVQDGTPTPSNPVDVNGVGERTENLFDKNRTEGIINNAYINQSGEQVASQNYYLSYPLEVLENSVYTWSFVTGTTSYHTAPTVAFYDENDVLLSVATHNSNIKHFTFTTPLNTKYIRGSVYRGQSQNTAMLLEGSTEIAENISMDYIPFGYEIPITYVWQTTPIYLGEAETTRQIQKLVLTGQENWNMRTDDTHIFYLVISGMRTFSLCLASHYKFVTTSIHANLNSGEITTYLGQGVAIWTKNDGIESVNDYKYWLSQQYNNGTPVTVWYVLATETTGTVNEPLMKIGNYADTLSNATAIPTTDGANTITVDTTVQPSEFTATWTGWHDSSVQEYDGTDWQ